MIHPAKTNQSKVAVLRSKLQFPVFVFVLGLGLLWFVVGPIPQDPDYHNFADQRSMLGIPNAIDVLSNIPFLLASAWGLLLLSSRAKNFSRIDTIYLVFFIGVFFTGLGSSYYHWAPDNMTLVWDRLPITITFMAFTAFVVSERYSPSFGFRIFPWLLVLGTMSVVYWIWVDDLRPYIIVQFGPILVLPVIVWRLEGPGTKWLWITICFYVLAKLLELLDPQIFQITGQMVSGHSLKHLAASAAVLSIAAKVATSPPFYDPKHC